MRSRHSPDRLVVRAPATTANVGPGFDCVGVALELWNELEVGPGDGEAADRSHLGIRAFERLASPEGRRFRWTSRIPRESGLGSSAAVIALGLVAASLLEHGAADPAELFSLGLALEGHGDNLAAALYGGVCLTWGGRVARVADDVPAVPIAVVPEATVSTAAARDALPPTVSHADAAFTGGRAALLGAALASGSPELFGEALADRLHEPYRAETAPLLAAVRESLPTAALGATLSGSGPTVIVWARKRESSACAAGLRRSFPDARVLPLRVSRAGASAAPASRRSASGRS